MSSRLWLSCLSQRGLSNRLGSARIVAFSQTRRVKFSIKHKVPYGFEMAVVGGAAQLGRWVPEEGLSLKWHEGDVWQTEVDLAFQNDALSTSPTGSNSSESSSEGIEEDTRHVNSGDYIEMKFIIRSPAGIEWQPGDNIRIDVPEVNDSDVILVDATSFDDNTVSLSLSNEVSNKYNGLRIEEGAKPSVKTALEMKPCVDTISGAPAEEKFYNRDHLEKMTVVNLRTLAKKLGLRVSGRKAELIDRIAKHEISSEL